MLFRIKQDGVCQCGSKMLVVFIFAKIYKKIHNRFKEAIIFNSFYFSF